MSYTIMISEAQRVLIVKALALAFAQETPLELGIDLPEDRTELDYLPSMFEELPAMEAESPGVLHGFSL